MNFMTRLTVLFLFCFHLAAAQKTEQIALNYFVAHLADHEIKFQDGHAVFDSKANAISYQPRIAENGGKVFIPKSARSSVNGFYKVIHDAHDIHIQTMKARRDPTGYIVSFVVTTNYGNFTKFEVLLDRDKKPHELRKIHDQLKNG
jgi:hypothetical protein